MPNMFNQTIRLTDKLYTLSPHVLMDNSWMFSGEMLRAKTPEDHVMSETPEPKIKPKRVLWTTNLFFVSLVHVIAGASLMFVRPKLQTILFCLLLWQLAGIGMVSSILVLIIL